MVPLNKLKMVDGSDMAVMKNKHCGLSKSSKADLYRSLSNCLTSGLLSPKGIPRTVVIVDGTGKGHDGTSSSL